MDRPKHRRDPKARRVLFQSIRTFTESWPSLDPPIPAWSSIPEDICSLEPWPDQKSPGYRATQLKKNQIKNLTVSSRKNHSTTVFIFRVTRQPGKQVYMPAFFSFKRRSKNIKTFTSKSFILVVN